MPPRVGLFMNYNAFYGGICNIFVIIAYVLPNAMR